MADGFVFTADMWAFVQGSLVAIVSLLAAGVVFLLGGGIR